MKTVLSLFLGLAIAMAVRAQSPNLFNFQGVAKGANGSVLASKSIRIRSTIQSQNGSIAYYSETRQVTTSSTGLFSFQIGSAGALATTGSLNSAPWSSGNLSLKTEMDPNGGSAFVVLGSQSLSSVPYARFADVAGALAPGATFAPINISKGAAVTGSILTSGNGSTFPSAPANLPVSTLTLPYIQTTDYSDLRPAMSFSNTSTGGVMSLNSNFGSVLISENNSALVAQSGGAASTMRLTSPAANDEALLAEATGTGGAAIKAYSQSGLALSSSGKIKLWNVREGYVAVSDANGEVKWIPGSHQAYAPGVVPNQIIGGTQSGSNTLVFDGSSLNAGGIIPGWDATNSKVTVPCKGTFRISGMLQLEAFQTFLTTTPCLKSATYLCRITNPGNPALNRTEILATKNSPFGWGSGLTVIADTYLDLNQGEVLEFVAASEFRNVNPKIKAATASLALFRGRI